MRAAAPGIGLQAQQEVDETGGARSIEGPGGFVGEDELGIADEGADHGDALTFPARELRRHFGGMGGETNPLEQTHRAAAGRFHVRGVPACEDRHEDILQSREVRQKVM
jgi:hypothetical protein